MNPCRLTVIMEHRSTAVAGRAIKLAVTEGSFKASDVTQPFTHEPSPATVRRVLRQLEADDWLERDTDRSSIWRAGTLARTLGDMSERSAKRAEREPIGPGDADRGDGQDGFSLNASELLGE